MNICQLFNVIQCNRAKLAMWCSGLRVHSGDTEVVSSNPAAAERLTVGRNFSFRL